MKIIIRIEGCNGVYGNWNYPILPREGDYLETRLLKYFIARHDPSVEFDEEKSMYLVAWVEYDYIEEGDEIIAVLNIVSE